jgi:hypothetical protein
VDYQKFQPENMANVPKALKQGERWVCWKSLPSPITAARTKPRKVPINPHDGTTAKANDPSTWSTFKLNGDFYMANADALAGVGREFHKDDGITGIDFDNCLDANGNLIPTHLAATWLPLFNSYTEISPSGTGVKTFVTGVVKDGKRHKNTMLGAEMYDRARFFTITGKRMSQYSGDVEERQSVLDDFYKNVFGTNGSAAISTVAQPSAEPTGFSDEEIIKRAGAAKNGAKFKALWDGKFDGSQSEADAALCSLIWFWSGDREQVERLFGQSALGQRAKWTDREDYRKRTLDATCNGKVYCVRQSGADAYRAFMDDPRPKIQLPCDDRLVGEFAEEVAEHLAETDVYCLNDHVVLVTDGITKEITAQEIRTLVEKHFACYKVRSWKGQTFDVGVTMPIDVAHCLLASPFLKERLRRIVRVNRCQLPILRGNGVIELLPDGYDATSKTLTVSTTDYPKDVPLAEAVKTIDSLLSEFIFADGERSKSVAVAMLLSLYAGHLIPQKANRPCFTVTKNAEGAGAGTLVALAVAPVSGEVMFGTKADSEEELKKTLLTAVREAQLVVILDNEKSKLESKALESFLSASDYKGRRLGVNENIVGPNLATVFATMNGGTVSPDMRRRSLFVELRLDVERAEDREFKRRLTTPVILSLRPAILGALWSLVRHWDSKGRPTASRNNPAFPEWADVAGGIVEAAGFGCCLETARVALTADTDGDDMRNLVAVMATKGKPLTFDDLTTVARELGCFESIIGTGIEFKRAERSRLGCLLARYDKRLVGGYRFLIDGKGHSRKFRVDVTGNGANWLD